MHIFLHVLPPVVCNFSKESCYPLLFVARPCDTNSSRAPPLDWRGPQTARGGLGLSHNAVELAMPELRRIVPLFGLAPTADREGRPRPEPQRSGVGSTKTASHRSSARMGADRSPPSPWRVRSLPGPSEMAALFNNPERRKRTFITAIGIPTWEALDPPGLPARSRRRRARRPQWRRRGLSSSSSRRWAVVVVVLVVVVEAAWPC